MAQQNTGCGCGTLIALVALWFVLAYWQVFLVAALLVLAIAAVLWGVLLQNQEQLRVLVEAAERRVRLAPCQIQDSFVVIQAIKLAGSLQTPRIDVHCSTLTCKGTAVGADEICISLSPPAERQQLRTSSGVASWLRSGGITQLEELSVEAKAVAAAMECLRERSWASQALADLDGLRGSVIDTLRAASKSFRLRFWRSGPRPRPASP